MEFWWEKTAEERMVEWLMEYEATVQELKKNVESKLEEGVFVSVNDKVYHPESSSLLSSSSSSNGSDGDLGAIVRVDDQVYHHHGEFVDDQYGNQYFDDFGFGELGLDTWMVVAVMAVCFE
ncbi:hypothetical protein EZV62_025977 [Acer yangbiense]|uniref:Uncharacterized protein n=1 Tax=Acer yangbiense TaxID=1000413 RepID=A0A5C7H0U7_9ROSI|nr:hypothetical protein EZV62_025977 [Acer yangbiense]